MPSRDEDRTTRARIRDAAIAYVAENGVAAASVRAIASAAGVSPGLVIHHFGSKEGLRVACDEYVAAWFQEQDAAASAAGTSADLLGSLREIGEGSLLRYLARTLAEGTRQSAELVDLMVKNAVAASTESVRAGMINPSRDDYARTAVLSIWSLGALVLHEHLARLLGEDITRDLTRAPRYLAASIEIMGQPLFTDAMYARARDGLAALTGEEPHETKEG